MTLRVWKTKRRVGRSAYSEKKYTAAPTGPNIRMIQSQPEACPRRTASMAIQMVKPEPRTDRTRKKAGIVGPF